MPKNILIIGGCGYIGSYLFEFLRDKATLITIDLEWFGNNVNSINIVNDYAEIPTTEWFYGLDAVILLAAHSSIPMCKYDKKSVIKNNILNFVNLIEKIPRGTKFIYASSSSVYGSHQEVITEETPLIKPTNWYDMSKQCIDNIIQLTDIEYYGLRFASVNGYSKNFRNDLIVNAMTCSAIRSGLIETFDAYSVKSILGLNDLSRAIYKIIMSEEDNKGIYNISSLSATVLDIANIISYNIGGHVAIKNVPGSGYNYNLSTQKFKQTFDFEFEDTIESIAKDIELNHKPDDLEKHDRDKEIII